MTAKELVANLGVLPLHRLHAVHHRGTADPGLCPSDRADRDSPEVRQLPGDPDVR